jgi:3-hydroxyacyl-[acyl-carrier-protein] dehydratase
MRVPTDLLQLAMRSLPHGPEFRFVDRLISLEPGKTGVGEYLVRGDEYYLRGHLPGEPIFPGVLLVEAGAQVAGMVAQEDPANPSLPRLKLTALRAVKIFGSAKPGETLRIEATITGRLGLMVQATASAHVGDVKVMSAELVLIGTANKPLGTQGANVTR